MGKACAVKQDIVTVLSIIGLAFFSTLIINNLFLKGMDK